MSPKKKAKKRKILRHTYSHTHLSLSGKKLDPEKITNALSIEPDRFSYRGEEFMRGGKLCKTSIGFWGIKDRLRSDANLRNKIKDILDQIMPKKKVLRKILKEAKGELTIAVEPPKGAVNSNYFFPAELINEFTSLGIDINLSFWDPHTFDEFWETKDEPSKY